MSIYSYQHLAAIESDSIERRWADPDTIYSGERRRFAERLAAEAADIAEDIADLIACNEYECREELLARICDLREVADSLLRMTE